MTTTLVVLSIIWSGILIGCYFSPRLDRWTDRCIWRYVLLILFPILVALHHIHWNWTMPYSWRSTWKQDWRDCADHLKRRYWS